MSIFTIIPIAVPFLLLLSLSNKKYTNLKKDLTGRKIVDWLLSLVFKPCPFCLSDSASCVCLLGLLIWITSILHVFTLQLGNPTLVQEAQSVQQIYS